MNDRLTHYANNARARVLRAAEVECLTCNGCGTIVYGSSSTWRGGMGAAAMTLDVCDKCWGTGRRDQTGEDLRALYARLRAAETAHGAESSSRWLAAQLGVEMDVVSRLIPPLAKRLRNLRGVEFWTARLCDRLADALETMTAVAALPVDMTKPRTGAK